MHGVAPAASIINVSSYCWRCCVGGGAAYAALAAAF